jgi:pimeloyl-ACP methyl ester carboxylesterase
MSNPIVLVHGYSDQGQSWAPWQALLLKADPTRRIRVCTYQSLVNEVSIKDIAEGFDRALATRGGLDRDEPFDAIVHSTGMLVLRAWLAADPLRVRRLKHLIALAPATFGSPLAKKGRSWLGAIFKGNRHLGPDFLDAGDVVLDNLELASPFTWSLAEQDVLGPLSCYNSGQDTPWVFVFCGTATYAGLRRIVDTPGTDGTVRRAGCSLNVRRIVLDMTESGMVARQQRSEQRIIADDWHLIDMPVHLIGKPDGSDGVNHATILSSPPDELVALVEDALQVTSADAFKTWLAQSDATGRMAALPAQYQQFVVHALDERGDPITDYHVQIFVNGVETEFDAEVDVYGGDASYRCFHADVAPLLRTMHQPVPGLTIRILAESGTKLVGYLGYGFERQDELGAWDASLHLTADMLKNTLFFRPYTTTLIRLYIDRQVLPPDRTQPCELLQWIAEQPGAASG